jgi:hypothetical protein
MGDRGTGALVSWTPRRSDSRQQVQGGIADIILDQTGSPELARAIEVMIPFNGHAILDMNTEFLSAFLHFHGVDYWTACSVAMEVAARRQRSRLLESIQWEQYGADLRAARSRGRPGGHIQRGGGGLLARIENMTPEQQQASEIHFKGVVCRRVLRVVATC